MTNDDKKRRIDNTRPILAQMVFDIFVHENNRNKTKDKAMGIGVSKNALISFYPANDEGEAAGTHPQMKQSYSHSPRPAC